MYDRCIKMTESGVSHKIQHEIQISRASTLLITPFYRICCDSMIIGYEIMAIDDSEILIARCMAYTSAEFISIKGMGHEKPLIKNRTHCEAHPK